MITALLDFLFPPRCPDCRDYTEGQGEWCPECRDKYTAPRLFLEAGSSLEAVFCLTPYEGAVKELLHRLKFRRDEGALPSLVKLMENIWDGEPAASQDFERFRAYIGKNPVFVPVALHPNRVKERGFNQTALIWQEFLTKRGCQWLEALERRRETKPQYTLNKKERVENVEGAFSLREEYRTLLKGRTVVLVDDIYTSGATLGACAHALKGAGAAGIAGLALATGRNIQR